jgi:hypothetical protein
VTDSQKISDVAEDPVSRTGDVRDRRDPDLDAVKPLDTDSSRLWEAKSRAWAPELFSAPVVAQLEDELRREKLVTVPFFPGLMTGETDALIDSFAGDPELHHPVRGRIKGARAFAGYVADTNAWLEARNVSIEDVGHTIHRRRRGAGEVVLHLDGGEPVDLPVAIVADRQPDARIDEIRMHYSTWPLTGRHANRPPLLQPGIPLEHCAVVDDKRACALEYNVVWWGQTELPPEAGIAVYVRGESGKLAAARIYDDTDPPVGAAT